MWRNAVTENTEKKLKILPHGPFRGTLSGHFACRLSGRVLLSAVLLFAGLQSQAWGGAVSCWLEENTETETTYLLRCGLPGTDTYGENSTSYGNYSLASNLQSTAFGYRSFSSGAYGTAVGAYSSASGSRSLAMGSSSGSSAFGSVALGYASRATGNGSIAIGGADISLEGLRSINAEPSYALGTNAWASGYQSIAVGRGAVSSGANSISLGAYSTDSGLANVISVGSPSQLRRIIHVAPGSLSADSTDAINGGQLVGELQARFDELEGVTTNGNIAIGGMGPRNWNLRPGEVPIVIIDEDPNTPAVATGGNGIALGAGAQSLGAYSLALGGSTYASGSHSMAFGREARSVGGSSLALGHYAYSLGTDSIATGKYSLAGGLGDIALGSRSSTLVAPGQTQTKGNLAIGAESTRWFSTPAAPGEIPLVFELTAVTLATGGDSVALGAAASSRGFNSVALGAFSSDAGLANVVSVGSAYQQRRIIYVAPGTLSATSTDAVNGSQLYATNERVGDLETAVTKLEAGLADPLQALTALQDSYSGDIAALRTANLDQDTAIAANTAKIDALRTSLDAPLLALTEVQDQQKINTEAIAGNTAAITANATQISSLDGRLGTAEGDIAALQSLQGQTDGDGAIAIGKDSKADGEGTVAQGAGAVARFSGSVAIGAGAKALADPTTAVGNNAVASGNNSVALGANTLASGDNAVALGQGSVATGANTVSVGDAESGLTRKITNVAPGTAPTDAVNVGQLDAAVSRLEDKIDRTGAIAMAASQIHLPAGFANGLGVGAGGQGGQSALALGYVGTLRDNVTVRLTAGVSGSTRSYGGGLAIGW